MKDLERLKYFLGIEVLRSQHGIFICQKKYILDLLVETGMIDCKPAETPMIVNQKLYIDDEAKTIDNDRYKRMVGKLISLSHTRPDIAYAVGVVVALSSAEAKFKGIAKGVVEALWMRKLLSEVGYPSKEVTRIMYDNKAAIQISKNPVQHDRTKHVEIDRHFIKEKLEAGIIKLPFVKSQDQLADILTKSVGADWGCQRNNKPSSEGSAGAIAPQSKCYMGLVNAEAEFRGIAKGVTKALWIRKLLSEVGTKHVEIDRHFIKEKLEAGIIKLPFVKSQDQLADILTKSHLHPSLQWEWIHKVYLPRMSGLLIYVKKQWTSLAGSLDLSMGNEI
nr:putative ribonuclease H-like domain-containing protein [Tanacetum cinerariifolium]